MSSQWATTCRIDQKRSSACFLLLSTSARMRYILITRKKHAAWGIFGSQFTNRVTDFLLEKPKGVHLSSFSLHEHLCGPRDPCYEGPFTLCRRVDPAGNPEGRPADGRH